MSTGQQNGPALHTAHQAARQNLWNSMGGRDIDIMKLFTMSKTLWALFKYATKTGQWRRTLEELPELREEQGRERRRQQWKNRNGQHVYPTYGPSTNYYSATGTSRTTLWPLQADDKDTWYMGRQHHITYTVHCTLLHTYGIPQRRINGEKKIRSNLVQE